jgi:hypothetical protein
MQLGGGVFSTIWFRNRQFWQRTAAEVCMKFSKPAKSDWVLTLEPGETGARVGGIQLEREGRQCAPIGAQVFRFERRNHYKTIVYGLVRLRIAVDTPMAADKLKKCKKGLKFERFESFLQSVPIDCVRRVGRGDVEIENWKESKKDSRILTKSDLDETFWCNRHRKHVRHENDEACHEGTTDANPEMVAGGKDVFRALGQFGAFWSQLEREARKMNGHPFAPISSARGPRSESPIFSAFPRFEPRPGSGLSYTYGARVKIPEVFELEWVFDGDHRESRAPIGARSRGLLSRPECPSTRSSFPYFESFDLCAPHAGSFDELADAAQPLQHEHAEGWGDCSTTQILSQESAGRGKEEMPQ